MFKVNDEVRIDDPSSDMYGENCEIQAINGDDITLFTAPELTIVKVDKIRPTTLAFNQVNDGEIFKIDNCIYLKINHEESLEIGHLKDTDNYNKVHTKIGRFMIFRMDTIVKLVILVIS